MPIQVRSDHKNLEYAMTKQMLQPTSPMGAAPIGSTVFESFTDRSKKRSGDLPKEGDKDDDRTAQSFSMVIKSHNDMRLLADIPPSEGRPILGRLVEDVYDADPFPLSVLQVFP